MSNTQTQEEWREVPGYNGKYQVSNMGNLISFVRDPEGRPMKPGITGNRSQYLGTSLRVNGQTKTYMVHQLVAIAFLDYELKGRFMVVDHIDGDTFNNRLDNLQIITQQQNTEKRQWRGGRYTTGCIVKYGNRYTVKITINKKQIYIGRAMSVEQGKQIVAIADELKDQFTGDTKAFRNLIKDRLFS